MFGDKVTLYDGTKCYRVDGVQIGSEKTETIGSDGTVSYGAELRVTIPLENMPSTTPQAGWRLIEGRAASGGLTAAQLKQSAVITKAVDNTRRARLKHWRLTAVKG